MNSPVGSEAPAVPDAKNGAAGWLSAVVDSRHAPPLAANLSCLPAKRALFAIDSYFRDSWEDACDELGDDADAFLVSHATLLLKPDAICGRRAHTTITWLVDNGLTIVDAERVALTRHSVRACWQYQWNTATRDRRDVVDRAVDVADSLLVLVRGPAADAPLTVRLTAMKGAVLPDLSGSDDTDAARPDASRPDLLRNVLGREHPMLNFVHTTDEPADLIREIGIFLDAPRRRQLYAAARDGAQALEQVQALIEQLYGEVPERSLDLEHVLEALRARAGALPPSPEHGPLAGALARAGAHELHDWRALIADLRAAGIAVDAWEEVVLAVHLGTSVQPGRSTLISAPTQQQWLDAGAPKPADTPVRHDQAIARVLVHKEAVAEVFVTDVAGADRDPIVLAGELPRTHFFFSDQAHGAIRYDVVAVLELTRQLGYVMAHRRFGVPLDQQFVVRQLNAEIDPGQLFREPDGPMRLQVDTQLRQIFQRDGTLKGLAMDFVMRTPQGEPVATSGGAFTWISPAMWRDLRTQQRESQGLGVQIPGIAPAVSALAPDLVGRSLARNVVLDGVRRDGDLVLGEVVVDPNNPYLFDHYTDHISGMLQVETCRQLAYWSAITRAPAGAAAAVRDLGIEFGRFGELDLATTCDAAVPEDPEADGETLTVQVLQRGAALCTARTVTVLDR